MMKIIQTCSLSREKHIAVAIPDRGAVLLYRQGVLICNLFGVALGSLIIPDDFCLSNVPHDV